MAVLFEITEGPLAGQRITWYGYFTDATIERTLESLEHAGWDGESELSAPKGLGSKTCSIVVQHEEYDGKMRAKVAWVNGSAGLALKQALSKEEALSFDKRMKATLAERRMKRAQQTPAASSKPDPRKPPF